ncbi:general secretion pathway protein GspK [Lysobacter sp. H21R4]|uniref:general secretion pathway protein GspK n=1 Tax=Lysobacter sp. H21R4 TaxID=2781021 RepID=UPI00188948B7|nr:type II secretion system protein GspK [Lysobacter sp. H21R4]QOY63923.1 general secretion pathway protein GspK [Lysobacter sp. H21R4]
MIVLLTALVGAFAMTARVEHMQGQVLARGINAQGAARAGLEYALHRLAQSDPRVQWHPDGRPYEWEYAGAQVQVRIVAEGGKVDLNHADATLMAGLLRALGSDPGEATRLAGAIIDWRDPDSLSQPAGGAEDADYAAAGRAYGAKDAEFESIAELEQVLGFTPALYAKIAPHVTVYSRSLRPDPAFAAAPVLDAMGMDGERIVAGRGVVDPATGLPMAGGGASPGLGGGSAAGGTYSIDSRAQLADGRRSLLRAVVLTNPPVGPGPAYTTLYWEEGASPR